MDGRITALDEEQDQRAYLLLEDEREELLVQREAIDAALGTTVYPPEQALAGVVALLDDGKIVLWRDMVRSANRPKAGGAGRDSGGGHS